jgi:hypothetical protein
MNRANGNAPDDIDGQHPDADFQGTGAFAGRFDVDQDFGDYSAYEEQEPLSRQLAQFAFVREEDDREVRLSFRDVPANEIARAFQASGALLISVTGERAASLPGVSVRSQPGWTDLDAASQEATALPGRKRRNRRGNPTKAQDDARGSRPNRHTGELTMRYFFSLGDLVYTINIASPTGIVDSIANIYPAAGRSERELQDRLAVVFRG